jgi:hypothetical protein
MEQPQSICAHLKKQTYKYVKKKNNCKKKKKEKKRKKNKHDTGDSSFKTILCDNH